MDGPTLATTLASESPPGRLLAARAVDLACGGNIKAIGLIAERIEGRVGMRPGETDPASEAREGVQQAIEDIVTAFTEAKLAQRVPTTCRRISASDRTPVVIEDEPKLARR